MSKRKVKTSVERNVKIGMKEVVNRQTGEIERVNHMEIREVDFNWNKIWLGHLLDVLDVIGNKKVGVMNWLLENRDTKTNRIHTTQRIVKDELGCSLQTVSDTFNALQSANALKKERNGVYLLNPDVVWVGGNDNRMDILLTYKKINEVGEDVEQLENKESINNDTEVN